MKKIVKVLPLLLVLAIRTEQTNAEIKSYIYYEDAECVKGNMISGTFIYGYNDSRMSGRGIVKENYYGPCKYFDGGHHDFMYGTKNGNYMNNGYCIRCNGMIGCTKTNYDCSDFQTSVPNQVFTLTASGSASSSGSESSSSVEEISEQEKEEAADVEYAVYKEISSVDVQESCALYSLLGIMSGFLSMYILYTSMKGFKRLRRSKPSESVDTSKFLEDREKGKIQTTLNTRSGINSSSNDGGLSSSQSTTLA